MRGRLHAVGPDPLHDDGPFSEDGELPSGARIRCSDGTMRADATNCPGGTEVSGHTADTKKGSAAQQPIQPEGEEPQPAE